MAYALVGSIGTVNAGTTSASPTFAQATSAGHLLICWGASDSGSLSISGTGWLTARSASSGSQSAGIFYKPNCGAGETAPTLSATGASNCFGLLGEFSGGDTSSPVDATGVRTLAAVTPATLTAGTVDVAAGELLVSCFLWALSKSGTTTSSDTYNNGATPTSNLNNDGTSTTAHYRFAWGITTGNTVADTDTVASSSMNISSGEVVISSFLLASTTRFPRNPAIDLIDPAFV